MVQVGPVSLPAAVVTGFWVLPPPDAWRLAAKLGTVALDASPSSPLPSPPRKVFSARRRRSVVVCAPCPAPVCTPPPTENSSFGWSALGGCCLAAAACGGAAAVTLRNRASTDAETPAEADTAEEEVVPEAAVRRGPVTRRTRVTHAA